VPEPGTFVVLAIGRCRVSSHDGGDESRTW
jgi:hypothetical protein